MRLFFEGVAGVADSAPGSSSTSSCSSPLSASSASQIFLASRLSSSRSSSSLSPSAAVGSKRVLELFRRADLSALRTIGAPVPPFILRGFLTGVEKRASRFGLEGDSGPSVESIPLGCFDFLLLPGGLPRRGFVGVATSWTVYGRTSDSSARSAYGLCFVSGLENPSSASRVSP